MGSSHSSTVVETRRKRLEVQPPDGFP